MDINIMAVRKRCDSKLSPVGLCSVLLLGLPFPSMAMEKISDNNIILTKNSKLTVKEKDNLPIGFTYDVRSKISGEGDDKKDPKDDILKKEISYKVSLNPDENGKIVVSIVDQRELATKEWDLTSYHIFIDPKIMDMMDMDKKDVEVNGRKLNPLPTDFFNPKNIDHIYNWKESIDKNLKIRANNKTQAWVNYRAEAEKKEEFISKETSHSLAFASKLNWADFVKVYCEGAKFKGKSSSTPEAVEACKSGDTSKTLTNLSKHIRFGLDWTTDDNVPKKIYEYSPAPVPAGLPLLLTVVGALVVVGRCRRTPRS